LRQWRRGAASISSTFWFRVLMSVRFWSEDFCAACGAASAWSAVSCACFTLSVVAQPLARIATAAMENSRPRPNTEYISCLLELQVSPPRPAGNVHRPGPFPPHVDKLGFHHSL